MINLTWNLIKAHVSMNELHIKILNNSIVNILLSRMLIYLGTNVCHQKNKKMLFKEIFDIEFNCA